jgi:phosphoribosylanthranilate isomerase
MRSESLQLKVCGITMREQLEALEGLGVQLAGLIFHPGSARYVEGRLSPEAARATAIRKVGVFVDAGLEQIRKAIRDYGLWAVQLHGKESPAFCAGLKNEVVVIKAIGVGSNPIGEIDQYEGVTDYLLFDTATTGHGGSGKTFDWALLQQAPIRQPFFLSGGIGLEEVEALRGFAHPQWKGLDVNSRLEIAPGVKDMEQVAQLKKRLYE